MTKSIIVLSAIILVCAVMFVSVYSQEEITQIDNDVFLNPQRPPTVFQHDEHNETAEIDDCARCRTDHRTDVQGWR